MINENNIINNVNKASSTARIETEATNADRKLKLVVEKDAEGKALSDADKIVLLDDVTYGKDKVGETFNLKYDAASKLIEAGYTNGAVTAKLYQKEGTKYTEVGTYTFYVRTINPTSIEAHATRNVGTYEASMSLDAYGETTVTKVYLEKVAYDSEASVLKDGQANRGITFDEEGNLENNLKSFDLTDNKLSDEVVYEGTSELTTGVGYSVYYVVEDDYGNRSKVYGPVTITKDTPLSEAVEIEKVELTDFTKIAFDSASVTATLAKKSDGTVVTAKDKTFRITITRDGMPVVEKYWKVRGNSATPTWKLSTLGANSSVLNIPGKYQVVMYVLGDEETPDSEVAKSEVREVKKLDSVDVQYNSDTKKLVIGGDYEVGTDLGKIAGYKLALVKMNADGTETPVTINDLNNTVTDKEFAVKMQASSSESYSSSSKELTLNYNTVYKAKVTVVARGGQMAELNSEPMSSTGFFELQASAVTIDTNKTTDTSITLQIANLINIVGNNTTYTVEVLKLNPNYKSDSETPTESKYVSTGDVRENLEPERVSSKDIIVIDGLNPDTTYSFKVTVNVGDTKGYVLANNSGSFEETTLRALPSLTNLTVVEGPTTKVGEIAKTDTGISIGGLDIADEDISKYPANLASVKNLLGTNLQVDDVFTYDDNGLTVNIGDRSTDRTFTAPEKITIEGNNFSRKLTVNDKVKELTLKGNGEFDLTENTFTTVSTDENYKVTESINLTLENGVSVKGVKENTKLTVAKGTSNVKINGVAVSSSLETELIVRASNTVEVITTADNQNNNLTFNAPSGLVLTFVRDDNESSQTGTVTVTAGGSVSVSGKDMYLKGAVSIDTSTATGDYTIHMQDSNIQGSRTLTISGKPTVHARVSEVAPFELADYSEGEKGIEIKEYTVEDTLIGAILAAEKQAGGKYANYNDTEDQDAKLKAEIVADLNAYLSQFGIPSDIKATIDINKNSDSAVFDFSGVTQDVKNLVIKGLK